MKCDITNTLAGGIIADELNVKRVSVINGEDWLFKIELDYKVLGARFGSKIEAIKSAVEKFNQNVSIIAGMPIMRSQKLKLFSRLLNGGRNV
ncbi:MAG: DUF5915 domain-containing protein [Candidatus Omnitrophica bacterium]|nr:DUF5915 domain-containing protein [Candidatus Omnitrophota bacterium]